MIEVDYIENSKRDYDFGNWTRVVRREKTPRKKKFSRNTRLKQRLFKRNLMRFSQPEKILDIVTGIRDLVVIGPEEIYL